VLTRGNDLCDRCSASAVYKDRHSPDAYCAECAAYIGAHRRGEQYAAIEVLGFAVGKLRDAHVSDDRIAAALHDILTNAHSEGAYPVGGEIAGLGRDFCEDLTRN
jgi:hypothetical protein